MLSVVITPNWHVNIIERVLLQQIRGRFMTRREHLLRICSFWVEPTPLIVEKWQATVILSAKKKTELLGVVRGK